MSILMSKKNAMLCDTSFDEEGSQVSNDVKQESKMFKL